MRDFLTGHGPSSYELKLHCELPARSQLHFFEQAQVDPADSLRSSCMLGGRLGRPIISSHGALPKYKRSRNLRPTAAHQPLLNPTPICSTRFTSSRADATQSKSYFVTTPIFYVNAIPHIGHLHSCVVADVLARWTAWKGASSNRNVVFSTGTDEHGLKIQTQAQKDAEAQGNGAKADPQGLCDRISQRFRSLADVADIRYTRFIRTTDEDHKDAVCHFWRQLQERGFIYKGSHEGWYAVSDEAFYTDGNVKDVFDLQSKANVKVSTETGSPVTWTKEENYKFRMSAFQDQLIDWLESNPDAIQPPRFHSEVLEELRTQKLQDLSISRPQSRLQWGIPVPEDPAHTMYVWIDALINYATVTGYPWSGNEPVGSAWPPDVQVVGKDILRFHAIYWPSMLLALDLPLPRTILTHSHWKMGDGKMSKSRGNVVDPFQVIEAYGSDPLRWFLMRIGGNFAEDAVYAPDKLAEYYKKTLAGQLGNLAMRITNLKLEQPLLLSLGDEGRKVLNGYVEIPEPALTAEDKTFVQVVDQLATVADQHMSRFEMAPALERIGEVVELCNELVTRLQPWRADTPQRKGTSSNQHRAIYLTRETLRIVGALYRPFMPNKMRQMLAALHVRDGETDWGRLRIGEADVRVESARLDGEGQLFPSLFPRVESGSEALDEAGRNSTRVRPMS